MNCVAFRGTQPHFNSEDPWRDAKLFFREYGQREALYKIKSALPHAYTRAFLSQEAGEIWISFLRESLKKHQISKIMRQGLSYWYLSVLKLLLINWLLKNNRNARRTAKEKRKVEVGMEAECLRHLFPCTVYTCTHRCHVPQSVQYHANRLLQQYSYASFVIFLFLLVCLGLIYDVH